MARATVTTTRPDSLEIEYETFGSPDDPALLLVMGFAVQMIFWDRALCEQLAAAGRYVVRFDNRDIGLSSKIEGAAVDPMAVLTASLGGKDIPEVPYTLSDMGNDGIGLLDALGIDRAHIMGASMGGMIVQTMAIEHPERVLSVTSIMSSPGDPRVGAPSPEALQVLLTPPPTDRQGNIDMSVLAEVFCSKKYFDVDQARERAAAAYDRCFYPQGLPRQLAAIYASGDRSERLANVTTPTLVIHGRDDTLITPSGGTATAEAIPGAHLLLLSDMGHDLPRPLWPILVPAIVAFTAAAAVPVES